MLAFSNDYYGIIFRATQSVELFCAYDTNMRATLCEQTLENACKAYPMLRGAILHSDRGTQYTSELYRKAINRYGIVQSMNSAGGRCHDNAGCESMWARFNPVSFINHPGTQFFYNNFNTSFSRRNSLMPKHCYI